MSIDNSFIAENSISCISGKRDL